MRQVLIRRGQVNVEMVPSPLVEPGSLCVYNGWDVRHEVA